MSFRFSLIPTLALLATPHLALAQDAPSEAAPAAEAPAAIATPEQDQPFLIKRGWFAEADLGVFFTFGGRNTNVPEFPSRGISNVQPFVGVFFGHDLWNNDKMNLAAGLKLGLGYSTGSGRVSEAEIGADSSAAATRSADFGIAQAGVGLAFAYLVSPRVAITGKLDGGLAIVDPSPFLGADEAGAGGPGIGGLFGVGAGVEYYTLLNDFSVGLDLRFNMALLGGGSIPGLGVTIPVKYTF